jgi:hypothetical protein
MSAQVVEGGSVFRVKCDFRCFDASTPYDNRCDESKRGTAFLLQLNGVPVIVTAHHVVSNAVTVTVTSPTLGDGEARTLKLIGCNPHLDIAILVGPPEIMALTPFLPQRSSNLKPRHPVTCVGFALGTMRTHTTTGTVSGRNEFPHNRIQTDTAVNPGNSGGPMLDAETRRVVGVVTSGMNNAQTTNFFTPMDEAYYAIRRIVTRYRESGSTLGVDMGYHLSAVVRSVNADACLGARGGALVAATHPDIGLAAGDVILAVADPQGTMVDVNAHMRVSAPSVWAYDAVDFRSLLDAMTPLQPEARWKMLVRRSRGMEQGEMLVDVLVGEQRMRSRELFPDCRPVEYVTFGGLVIQTLSESHIWAVSGVTRASFRRPSIALDSRPMITHVASGCPFASHGAVELAGAIVCELVGARETRSVATLEDVDRAMREIDPIVVVLDDGSRVGAAPNELRAYDARQVDDALRRGRHAIRLGARAEVVADLLGAEVAGRPTAAVPEIAPERPEEVAPEQPTEEQSVEQD